MRRRRKRMTMKKLKKRNNSKYVDRPRCIRIARMTKTKTESHRT